MPFEYHYTVKKFTNDNTWIKLPLWELIPRVSDVIETLACEWKAYDNNVNRKKRGEDMLDTDMVTYSGLRGTIGHYDIEVFIAEDMGVEIEPLRLSVKDEKLLVKIRKAGLLDDMYSEVSNAFDSFMNWWDAYNPIPVFPEKEIVLIKYTKDGTVDPTRSLKGTIDFIAQFDVDEMSENAKKELRKGGRSITHDKFVSVVDWKTGANPQPSHPIQLAGYYYLVNESGYIKDVTKDVPYFELNGTGGIPFSATQCVLLGAKTYKNKVYDTDATTFFRAWDKFNDPKAVPYKEKTGLSTGIGFVCVFCAHRNLNCPLFTT